ncbi:[SSU ribosomal protein S18P]-alanine acetyltransferase [Persephonella hydrogeniphila]|uniref:[Ribosomal protein bS18]-alanine N-acetyltransferase n=1 Tax=Persephonella hydrogeniphila TaxID=198703 RepID=A0A285N281_9AQUI|nr:ribosomal protein S18-alanine N-acetyltransferase [Persephonella hydrogeniphila]SNZ03549.1 [SSU ribosomal protein S18P]-alanine acetyltransferase [Persephonella hydrogeniphila]
MKIKKKDLRIADFRQEYLPQVEEILKENFQYPWSSQKILSSNSFSVKKVVIYENKILGFFSGEIIFSEGSITMIAVKKEFQNKGIGSFIMDWFIKLTKEKGVKDIWLEVSEKNKKAIRFYEKLGFIVENVRKNYYRDGSDALIMRLPVNAW